MTTHDADAVQCEIRIAARPETVFPFFTDAGKMVRWKGLRATLDPRPGGVYRVDINGEDVARGEYVEIVPNRRGRVPRGGGGGAPPPPPPGGRAASRSR